MQRWLQKKQNSLNILIDAQGFYVERKSDVTAKKRPGMKILLAMRLVN
jgi:hypothetical protein